MRNQLKFILLAFITIAAFSCSTPYCEEADCGPNGTCNEETEQCDCNDFYEGDNCELELRERFEGVWSAVRADGSGSPFDLSISKGVEIDQIQIQSPGLLQNFTMSGMLTDAQNVDIPDFMISIASNVYSGAIVAQDSANLVMNLDVLVNGQGDKISTQYNLSK